MINNCPNCGGVMDRKDKSMECPYCGSIFPLKNIAAREREYSDKPETNLSVLYYSRKTNKKLTVEIPPQRLVLFNGEKAETAISDGEHTINFIIGNKKYSRNIISEKGKKIVINVNSGRVNKIDIFKGYIKEKMDKISGYYPNSGLSVAAFVLSLTFYGAPAGLILGIVDLCSKKNKTEYRHKLSGWAIAIGIICIISLINDI